jgi:hypothetical protein
MDGQDGGGSKQKTTKPHGNPHPKRGSIMKQIIRDLTGGGGGGGNDSGSGGGGGDTGSSGSAAGGGGCYGTY